MPIDRFIVDFACLKAKLIVELDGEQHGREPGLTRDAARDHGLQAFGFKVLRFWNADVNADIASVLDTICEHIGLKPHPGPADRPSPPGRVDEGIFAIGDLSLEWQAWGPDNAPTTLVLLHEGLGSVGLWLDFPAALAEATGLRVIAYSRAGYGKSSPVALPRPLDYMTREAQDVLPNVLDGIGAPSVILVGHSDGATIAAIHAGTIEDSRIAGVVLIAPHFFTEQVGIDAIAQAKAAYETGTLRERLSRWHRHVDCAFYGWNIAWLDPEFRAWNVEDVLPGIRVPVCVIQGETDAYGTLAQVHAVERAVTTRVETHVLPDVGHSPHREARDATVSIIARFVDSCIFQKP